ncbi:MAG: hypothetical protein Q4D85_07795 [Corynebacterium sp.]|uniref:hypothetical protein n=1 Tax=Corynebacterium sp. TaxID=1720 RepID=UPI0026DCA99F|nr:hypothetical protein [Corynebacterium sp.]MDO5098647.1 hypothetical protein [Corynebacterium sp.]
MDTATNSSLSPLSWVDDELLAEDGRVIAHVTADLLVVDGHRLLLESAVGTGMGVARLRATSDCGSVFTLRKASMTVRLLQVTCGDRKYTLERDSMWRTARTIRSETGESLGTISTKISGVVQVSLVDAASVPIVDLAFFSYGCVLIDAAVKNLRY